MRRLCIGIAVVVVGVHLVPGVADSAAKKKHKVDVSVRAAVVGTSGNSNIVAGTLSGPPARAGGVGCRSTPSGAGVAARYTAFYRRGTRRGTSLLTATSQPDGS